MTHMIAPGHDNEAGLLAIDPQPRCPGIFEAGEEIFAGDGTVYEDGEQYAELIFSMIEAEDLDDFETSVGLDNAKSAPVTVSLPQRDRETIVNYNGQIIRPRNVNYQYWYNNAVYRIKNLEPIP